MTRHRSIGDTDRNVPEGPPPERQNQCFDRRNMPDSTRSFKMTESTQASANPVEGRHKRIASMKMDDLSAKQNNSLVSLTSTSTNSEALLSNFYDSGLFEIFSLKRPRDLTAGLSSAIKNIFKGFGLGVLTLIAAPACGAHTDGLGGFFKGLGAGVVAAIVLPVTGVGFGITQAARGVINTPNAVMEKMQGKEWDKRERVWKEDNYCLSEDFNNIKEELKKIEDKKKAFINSSRGAQGIKGTEHDSSKKNSVHVVDTTYYEVLQVSPEATPNEIRKSYYKLAKDSHPDKNSKDPNANSRFQALGEAYQVLGDEKRRAEYDKYGKDAAEQMCIIDSELFFTMMFGSSAMEPFIGKLKLTRLWECIDDIHVPGNITTTIMELEQRKREVELAITLRQLLEEFISGNEQQKEDWKKRLCGTADTLCKYSFGDAIIEAIGWVYVNCAEQFTGKHDSFLGLGATPAIIQEKNRSVNNFCKITSLTVKASLATRRLMKSEKTTSRSTNSDFQEKEREGQKEQMSKGGSDTSGKLSFGKKKTRGNEEKTENSRSLSDEARDQEKTLPLILETMLRVTLLDIENTVREAAKKMIKENCSSSTRLERTRTLKMLGEIFQNQAREYRDLHKEDKIDVLTQLQNAFIQATIEKESVQSYKEQSS